MSEAEETKDELDTLTCSQKTSQISKQYRSAGFCLSITNTQLNTQFNSIIKGIKHYSAAVHESNTVKITTISTKDKLQLQDFNCK